MSIKCDVFTIQYSFYTMNACFFRTLAVIDASLSYIYHHQYSIAGCVLLRLKMDPDTDDCRQLIEEEGGISITYRLSDPDTDDCPQFIEEEGGISITYRLRDPDTDDCPQLIGEEGGISITYRLRLLCTCRAIAAIILIVLLIVIVIVVFRVVFGIINKSAKSNSVKGTYLSS